jgi:2-keto-4-pentenoate hydratase/2-oxohepta-3-ene-1,7-dioic acid hydratase in catechol pathway
LIDAEEATGNSRDVSVLNIIEDGADGIARADAALAAGRGQKRAVDGIVLLAPIPLPQTILCAGANYADHAAEMARAHNRPPPVDPHELGLRSWHFIKLGRCVTGPGATITLPRHSKKVDWEVELAVIIGKVARNVSEADALDYVAGYTVANDLSARDLGRRDKMPDNSSFKNDWVSHKCFDGACPLGPYIALARDIPNPHTLKIGLDVNGVEKQNSNTSELIFNVNEQIADITGRMTLYPGDIILTGTPAGVGNGRGEFLKAGDVVRGYVEGIGELINSMA